jgi:pheromone shutdown protein TraB
MANNNLYLVGTVHIDLDGKTRLDTLLDRLSPSIIALEFHKERESSYLFRKSPEEERRIINACLDKTGLNLTSLQRNTLIESGEIISKAMGYEFTSSKDYLVRKPSSKLEYIDLSLFEGNSEKFAENFHETLISELKHQMKNPEALQILLGSLDKGIASYMTGVREGVKQTYDNINEMEEVCKLMGDPESIKILREVLPPSSVEHLIKIYNPQRDKVMGEKIRKLYSPTDKLVAIVGLAHLTPLKATLKDLNPKVITLAEYDSI